MSGALIGLLGVLVGGVLTGIVSVAVERARERDRGVIAASILRDEILSALSSLKLAKETRTWWPLAAAPKLPAVWEKHGAEFRFVAKPDACELVRSVVDVVTLREADVVDRAARKAQGQGNQPAPDAVIVSLETDDLPESQWKKNYEELFNTAAEAATTQLKPAWNPTRVLGGLAATLVLGVFVWQLSAPVYTKDAVARALVDQTGADVVACHAIKGRDDAWDCDLFSFDHPDCSLFSTSTLTDGPIRVAATARVSAADGAPSQCTAGDVRHARVRDDPQTPYMAAVIAATEKKAREAAAKAATIKPEQSKFLGFIPRLLRRPRR